MKKTMIANCPQQQQQNTKMAAKVSKNNRHFKFKTLLF